MSIEAIIPANEKEWLELRAKDVTSTEVSALFGISPYCTEFELWHRKHDLIASDFQENERTQWGQRLQDSIAAGIAADKNWNIRKMDEYMRDTDLRMGSSFDFAIEMDGVQRRGYGHPGGILEVKNVDSLIYRYNWAVNDDGTIEAPAHIEIQVQHQLALSGRDFAHIGAFVGGNRVILIDRKPDPEIIAAIKKKVADFWASVDAHQPPAPDFTRDAAFVAKLYGFAEPGKVFDARGNERIKELCRQHRAFGLAEKEAASKKEGLKAEILTIIGDAEKVLGDEFSSITAGVVGPAHIEYDREGYRMFRINWPREKKK